MTAVVTEELAYFPCDGVDLAGILSVPAEPNGLAVLLPWGSGAYPSSGRNRVRTYLTRSLASGGFHAFRFDKPGVGESEGEYELPDLSAPQTAEVLAAAEWLRRRGLTRLAIVGNCFGGWSSLMAAPSIIGLEAMVALNSPVRRDHGEVQAEHESWRWWLRKLRQVRLRRLLRPDVRARYRRRMAARASNLVGGGSRARRYRDAVQHLFDQRIPLLLLYGAHDDFWPDLEIELTSWLGAALDRAGPPSRVITVEEPLEGCGNLDAQELLHKIVVPWLEDLPR